MRHVKMDKIDGTIEMMTAVNRINLRAAVSIGDFLKYCHNSHIKKMIITNTLNGIRN